MTTSQRMAIINKLAVARNMARTSVYGAGTKADAMSTEYKEYILELNARTYEVWTGDRKFRLTSAPYAQKHDGMGLAQTVIRLLKKRSVWAGGEDLSGITITIKYRNNVPEEIVDSIEEAFASEGFATNEINKPAITENKRRARNMAKTSMYGRGTKAEGMSQMTDSYTLELNARTYEVWTGDRKFRLTSAPYAQKHDGMGLAQTVVRLLKKRSADAGGEAINGLKITIKYRNNVPEEIVDSIEEALTGEGFAVTEINKPAVTENKRRAKNAKSDGSRISYEVSLNPIQWEIMIDGEPVGIENGEADDFQKALLDFKKTAETEGGTVFFEYVDGETTDNNSVISVGALQAQIEKINNAVENKAAAKAPAGVNAFANRKSFRLEFSARK